MNDQELVELLYKVVSETPKDKRLEIIRILMNINKQNINMIQAILSDIISQQ